MARRLLLGFCRGSLVVVDVTLDRGTDDTRLIFEGLNSTGIHLSQSDLIRNFILMQLPEKDQTRLYVLRSASFGGMLLWWPLVATPGSTPM